MWGGRGGVVTIKAMFFFLVLPLVFGLSSACGSETVTVDKAFNGREIKVRAGSTIRVELEQAGAAGYVWEIRDLDREHFEVESVATPGRPDAGDLVGGPVLKTWSIRVKTKGISELRFIHYRPWEGQEKAADSFVLRVRIL
jgi:predicted secreted protein